MVERPIVERVLAVTAMPPAEPGDTSLWVHGADRDRAQPPARRRGWVPLSELSDAELAALRDAGWLRGHGTTWTHVLLDG